MVFTQQHLQSYAASEIGHVRKENEDVFLLKQQEGFFLLADGMGGRKGGGFAAKTAISTFNDLLHQALHKSKLTEEQLITLFSQSYEKTNEAIFKIGQANSETFGMGTTFCALFFFEDKALISHVGDSRVYLFRNKSLIQITQDDTVEGSPHVLSKAIGPFPRIEPSIESYPCKKGDLFILCTDGLTNSLSDRELKQILTAYSDIKEMGEKLMQAALCFGAHDNVTFILVRVCE